MRFVSYNTRKYLWQEPPLESPSPPYSRKKPFGVPTYNNFPCYLILIGVPGWSRQNYGITKGIQRSFLWRGNQNQFLIVVSSHFHILKCTRYQCGWNIYMEFMQKFSQTYIPTLKDFCKGGRCLTEDSYGLVFIYAFTKWKWCFIFPSLFWSH